MTARTIPRKPAVIIAGTALAALVLAGCSSDPSPVSTATSGGPASSAAAPAASQGPPAAGPHNAQDVTFVKDMLPHHTQAVEMADMALNRDTTPEVKALAMQIRGAQAPEISSMAGWLVGWGQEVPSPDSSTLGGSMGGGSMGGKAGGTGMMSPDQMTRLDGATGSEFAKMWLTDMTEHHTSAVDMARTETTSGQSTDAKKLAADIISSQTAEIATMKQLLSTLA